MSDADYKIRTGVTSDRRTFFKSKVSWSAVFAGALVAIVLQLVLSLLGIAIGASVIQPAQAGGASGLGIGAALWWVVTALISLFTGAWVASKMAATANTFEGMMHGIIVWCVATFIGFLMITTTVGQIMTGAFGVVGQTIAIAGEAAPQAAMALQGQQQQGQQGQQQNDALEGIMAEMRQLIQGNNGQQAQQQQQQDGGPNVHQQQQGQQQGHQQAQQLEQAVSRLLREGDDVSPQQRQEVVNMLVESTQMNQQQAERTVDNWIDTYQEARGNGVDGLDIDTDELRAEAGEIGEDVADALANAAFWAFIALVLGAIVAGIGGSVAASTEEDEHRHKTRDMDDDDDDRLFKRNRIDDDDDEKSQMARKIKNRGKDDSLATRKPGSDDTIDVDKDKFSDESRGTSDRTRTSDLSGSRFERDPNDPTYRREHQGGHEGRSPGSLNDPNEPGIPGKDPKDPRGRR